MDVSARDELLRWLQAAGVVGRIADDVADQILARRAHELAAKIRQERHSRYGTGLEETYWAADLIDPEADGS